MKIFKDKQSTIGKREFIKGKDTMNNQKVVNRQSIMENHETMESPRTIKNKSIDDKSAMSYKKINETYKLANKQYSQSIQDTMKYQDTPIGQQVSSKPLIEMNTIIKKYYIGEPNELEILHGIDLKINKGEFVAIVGESGSGKSTLMNIIGVLDKPTEGQYYLDGIDVNKASEKEMNNIRNQKIGFVFQNFNLIGRTSSLKNVELPMLYAGINSKKRTEKAMELLKKVGMDTRANHQPNELSGGQKQRVAIARSLANDPSIILADEPTGALDSDTSRIVMDIFHELNKKQNKTIILITHSKELAEECPRVITIKDGKVIDDRKGGCI